MSASAGSGSLGIRAIPTRGKRPAGVHRSVRSRRAVRSARQHIGHRGRNVKRAAIGCVGAAYQPHDQPSPSGNIQQKPSDAYVPIDTPSGASAAKRSPKPLNVRPTVPRKSLDTYHIPWLPVARRHGLGRTLGRHRRRALAAACHTGQGVEGPTGAALADIARGTARVLAKVPPAGILVPGSAARAAVEPDGHPARVQGVRRRPRGSPRPAASMGCVMPSLPTSWRQVCRCIACNGSWAMRTCTRRYATSIGCRATARAKASWI